MKGACAILVYGLDFPNEYAILVGGKLFSLPEEIDHGDEVWRKLQEILTPNYEHGVTIGVGVACRVKMVNQRPAWKTISPT